MGLPSRTGQGGESLILATWLGSQGAAGPAAQLKITHSRAFPSRMLPYNNDSRDHPLTKSRMFHTLAITLMLSVSSLPQPVTQKAPGGNLHSEQDIMIDTLSHEIHISNELHTSPSHDAPSTTSATGVFCFLTVPLLDTISLLTGLPPRPCQVLYKGRTL